MALRVEEYYPNRGMPAVAQSGTLNAAFGTITDDLNPFKKLGNDVDRLDTAQKALYVGGVLPPLRRIGSLPDSIKDDNWTRAALLTSMAAANLPGDLREIMRAKGEFLNLFKGVLPSAKNYKGQHAMNVLDGTFLEPLTRFKWLSDIDKPLYDTKLGAFLQKHLNIRFNPNNIEDIKIPGLKMKGKQIIKDRIVAGIHFEGNYAQRLAGKSLLRISVLGLIMSGLLEMPALVKSITKTKGDISDKSKAFGKQLIKSAGYVGLVTLGIVLTGGMFGTTALGSLAGMAVGSALGLMASNGLNKKVDKFFEPDKKEQKMNPFATNSIA